MDVTQMRQSLVARLEKLGHRVHDCEGILREPLDANFAEQAAQMESDEVTADLEHAAILEAERIKVAVSRIDAGSYGGTPDISGLDPPRMGIPECADRPNAGVGPLIHIKVLNHAP